MNLRGVPEGDPATHRRKRYVDATGRGLAVLGVLFVMAYTVYVLWQDRPQWVTTVIAVVLVATWVIFVIDVIIRISLTPRGRRWHYAWHHPFEVLSAILPVFRALRVVGLLQDLPVLKRHTPTAVRAQFITLALAYAFAWVFFLALATLDAERDAPGANITTFGDAIWWALVTIATVGYGDTYPVTSLGRFYAVLLMAGGIAIVGTASATIISYLNEKVAGLRHHGDALAAVPTLSTAEESESAPVPAPATAPAAAPGSAAVTDAPPSADADGAHPPGTAG
jgi:voltage-gated potassium channel